MGCSTSSRITAEQPPPKDQHYGKESKGLDKKDASLERVVTMFQGGSIAERDSESNSERMPSANEDIHEQDIDIKGELAKKPVSLCERERQTSSDILEELRMQGIINSPNTTSQNRKAGDTTARDEQQQKEFPIDRPKPIIFYESSTTRSEVDCLTSDVQKTSHSCQLSAHLNLRKGSWMEKEEAERRKSCFQDFNMVESDIAYNTVYEAF